MQPRLRHFIETLAILSAAVLLAFTLLFALHASLPTPFVHSLDLGVQAQIHRWTTPSLTPIMLALTFIGSIKVFIPAVILAITLMLLLGEREQGQRLVRKRQVSAIFAVAIGGALLLNQAFKTCFHRPRPDMPWSIGDEVTFSFPSGHSLFSCVLYGLIAYMVLERRARPIRRLLVVLAAAVLTLGIGLSRIYLGMHWPTDVLAGYLTGAIWLSAVILVDRRWRTRRHPPSA